MRRLAATMVLVVGLIAAPQVTAAPNSCTSPDSAYDTGGKPNRAAAVNDPLFSKQWGLRQIDAPGAWKQGALGEGAVVAVVDTGVDLSHPDLRSNLVKGKDFESEGEAGDCPGPQDRNGHGTHVSGIVAAVGDNGVGTVGVAPRAKIMPVRMGNGDEGVAEVNEISQKVAQGIRHAAENGADVINLSLNTGYVTDIPLSEVSEAIEFAWEEGAVIVVAAGNSEFPICDYPAADPLVLCVAATDRNGDVTSYSSRPAKPTDDMAVLAPGGIGGDECETDDAVWSTFVFRSYFGSEPFAFEVSDCGVKGYATSWGTSMASPHVAGVAALLSGLGLDNRKIVDCLLNTASNHGTYDRGTGYGIVNAAKAVRSCS